MKYCNDTAYKAPHNVVMPPSWTRRAFCRAVSAAAVGTIAGAASAAEPSKGKAFQLRYLLGSAMYGVAELSTILPHVRKTGAEHIDLWPKPHGNQREQVDAIGLDAFQAMLAEHQVKLGGISRYDLFPLDLDAEISVCAALGGSVLVGHGRGSRNLKGDALRDSVAQLAREMQAIGAKAAEHGITLAVENHSGTRLHSPDAVRWFADMAPPGVGLAFAPHHLPQDPDLLAELIEHCGSKLAFFYAQQHGNGSSAKQPRESELLQMPGRGPLDFQPLIAALKKINFQGFTEIFMHPYPRGLPIHDTPQLVTTEINRARAYLDACAAKAS